MGHRVYGSLTLLKPGGESEEVTDMDGSAIIGTGPGIFLPVDKISLHQGVLHGKFPFQVAAMVKGTDDIPGDSCLFYVRKGFIAEIKVTVAYQPLLELPELIKKRIPGKGHPGEVTFAEVCRLAFPGGLAIGDYSGVHRILGDYFLFVTDQVVIPAAEDAAQAQGVAVGCPADPVEVELVDSGQGVEMVEVVEA